MTVDPKQGGEPEPASEIAALQERIAALEAVVQGSAAAGSHDESAQELLDQIVAAQSGWTTEALYQL